ncbi:hypothetical protein CPB86DRAFT_625990 [Serendipita vermifera]|nr:hypothetical protein CPB86DRAFT_625990 [Serendipita vermifera]
MATTAELPFPHPRKLPNNVEVRECKAAISVLDQNIEDIRMQMQKLEKQLEDLDQKRANYLSYISPFRWLPVEILGEIADICLYNGTNITTLTSIHSTLRNAIIGMQSLWRHVRLMAKSTVYVRALSYDYLDATITYITAEQLEIALTRAGSAPLHLEIYLPVEHEMLELISLRQIQIQNFSIMCLEPSSSVGNLNFNSLNFSSLRELHIDDSCPDILKIMDMALNSTRNDLELYLTIYEAEQMVTILTHPLLQRITLFELYLSSSIFLYLIEFANSFLSSSIRCSAHSQP